MFSVGEMVVYSNHGVFKVKETTVLKITGKETLYYVLTPLFDNNSTFYVPVEKAKELNNLHKTLTKEELKKLFKTVHKTNQNWIENESERKEVCQNAINSNDRETMIIAVQMFYLRQKELKLIGKHIHACDEKFFKTAEKILSEEIAGVFGVSLKDVPQIIENFICD